MCGRVIQKSGPFRLAIVEGLDVSDSRMAKHSAALHLTDIDFDAKRVCLQG
jgi:hypothetical protein